MTIRRCRKNVPLQDKVFKSDEERYGAKLAGAIGDDCESVALAREALQGGANGPDAVVRNDEDKPVVDSPDDPEAPPPQASAASEERVHNLRLSVKARPDRPRAARSPDDPVPAAAGAGESGGQESYPDKRRWD